MHVTHFITSHHQTEDTTGSISSSVSRRSTNQTGEPSTSEPFRANHGPNVRPVRPLSAASTGRSLGGRCHSGGFATSVRSVGTNLLLDLLFGVPTHTTNPTVVICRRRCRCCPSLPPSCWMPLSEAWIDGLAGWASGAVVVAVVQPVDTVLTRAQALGIATATTATTATATATAAAPPQSYYQLGRQLTHHFGISSLWRGSAPMIYAVPFQNALLMGGYGIGKQWGTGSSSSTTTTNNNLWSVFIGGSVGGVAQSFLMSPVELIKVQQQVHQGSTTSASASAAPSALTATVRSLFFHNRTHWQRGLTATLLRDGIPHGVWFASYEWSKQELLTLVASTTSPTPGTTSTMNQVGVPMMAGALAATVAWVVGYPFDIIKTRIQATRLLHSTTTTTTTTTPPRGVVETGQELIQQYGVVRGLYKGFGLKLMRAIPASMIGFVTYETVAQSIRERM